MEATSPTSWIKLPSMPPVSTIFLPSAPAPKTSVDVDFELVLRACVRKVLGKQSSVERIAPRKKPTIPTKLSSYQFLNAPSTPRQLPVNGPQHRARRTTIPTKLSSCRRGTRKPQLRSCKL